MKLFHITLLLLTIVLSGCIDKEYEDCVGNKNLNMLFTYQGDGNSDIFSSQIQKVDLFVFDEEGCFVQKQTIDKTQLNTYQGAKLNLPVGTYRIVCWGNAFDNTQISDLNTLHKITDAYLTNAISKNGIVENSDSLYYAPFNKEQAFTIQVLPGGQLQQTTMQFRSAHIDLKVYIKGITDPDGAGGNYPATVELTQITPQYLFNKTTTGTSLSYTQQTNSIIQGTNILQMAGFCTPRFDNDNPIKINIKKKSDDSLLHQIDLKKFLTDNNIVVTQLQELTIPILIEFRGADVIISLPNWGETPVDPEM